MKYLNGFLEYNFWNNSLQDYLVALGILIGFLIFFKVFKLIILTRIERWAKKIKTDLDNELLHIVENIPEFAYLFISFYIALKFLVIPVVIIKILNVLLIILGFYWAARSVSDLIDFIIVGRAKKKGIEKGEKGNAYFAITIIAKIALWIIAFLLILSNLEINISTLVASLGIGGIAVALAMQNILSDIFSSFSIYFDKPFEVGDYIVVGDQSGTVKKIGIKTTRVQALQGEEIVFSNRELTTAMVRNFKKMKRRRIVFGFGVTYKTPTEKLKKIPKIVEGIIKKEKLTDCDRVHFNEFGDFSLNFEIVYFINSKDYVDYMNVQQSINLAIMDAFKKEKIEIAFPTQTIYMAK